MSSKTSKLKPMKSKDTTSRTKIKDPVPSTHLLNSRSLTRLAIPPKPKKLIPKILSKIQKNVQDLKKYCSDVTHTPNTSRKKQKKNDKDKEKDKDKPTTMKTVNNISEETIASVDEVKKGYLSVYGKETESIIELWKFYNSSIGMGMAKGKRTSVTMNSMSIGVKSSDESRGESGVQSAMSSIRVPLESINLSDLGESTNRRAKGKGKGNGVVGEILKNVIYEEEEECRPLQRGRDGGCGGGRVRNVDFSLCSEMMMDGEIVEPEGRGKEGAIKKYENCSGRKNRAWEINEQERKKTKDREMEERDRKGLGSVASVPEISIMLKDVKAQLEVEQKEVRTQEQIQEKVQQQKQIQVQIKTEQNQKIKDQKCKWKKIIIEDELAVKLCFDEPIAINLPLQKQQNFLEPSPLPHPHPEPCLQLTPPPPSISQSQRIFQKNMLINKRKQELNAKLKKGKPSVDQKQPNQTPHSPNLDEAVIIEDKPSIPNQLPLSKQDISLLQKLDQIDKELILAQSSTTQNYVFEALKNINKKKKFQKSKFVVAEIPRKVKKPMIVEFVEEQEENIETMMNVEKQKRDRDSKKLQEKEKEKQKEKQNNSLLDCEILGIDGEDSMLHDFEEIDIDL